MSTSVASKTPIERFATFMRTYFSALGLIVAAVPVLLRGTDSFNFYPSIKGPLTFLASLVSYLAVAAVFGARGFIGKAGGRGAMKVAIPSILGALSLIFFVLYSITISNSVEFVILNSTYPRAGNDTSIYETFKAEPRLMRSGASPENGPIRLVGQFHDKPGQDYTVVGDIKSYEQGTGEPLGMSASRYSLPAFDEALASTAPGQVPFIRLIYLLYILSFACASTALMWFGTLEYNHTD
jgi:hypothetical protein